MKEKILIVLLVILLLGLIALGLFTYNLYQHVDKNKTEEIEKPDENVIPNENEIKKEGMTDEEILILGKKLYNEAIDVIGNLTFGAEGIRKDPFEFDARYPGYMKTVITVDEMRNNILKDFTEEFKDGILDPSKGIPDKDIIRVAGDEVFVVDAARGMNMQYAWQDDLELVIETEDKIEFTVMTKYIAEEAVEKYNRKVFLQDYKTYTFPASDLETVTGKFVLIKENGNFKISEFNLPY